MIHEQENNGNHLSFRYGEHSEQVLIVGHFDTVWDVDAIPYAVKDGEIYGPGVYDMKSGLIEVIWAFKACKELGIPLNKSFVVLCNSDEEIGSHSSKGLISELALKSAAAIICEPASDDGAIKSARKGSCSFNIKITGIASHAGSDHAKGRSAIEEMAHQILYIHSLTDYAKGTTLNIGVVGGGTRPNVVADTATMKVDMRMTTMAEAERVIPLVKGIKPHRDGIQIEVKGDLGKPPFERTEATMRLFSILEEAAEDLDMKVTHTMVGGCSDGNTTAALGVPTLDGLGAVGGGGHALHEHIIIDQTIEKAILFTQFITKL